MMGYFSNGIDGERYEAQWCARCIHNLPEHGCPALTAHLLWNYDECNKPESILHRMIPRTPDGGNGQCFGFTESKP